MITVEQELVRLPSKPEEPSRKWTDQKFLMIGQGKIGKSDFWSHGEKTLFLECEPGLNHLRCMRMPCRGWKDVQKVGALLYQAREAGNFPYDTLVIDTGDRFVDFGNEEIIERAKAKYKEDIADKINSIGDIPNGSGWYWSTELVKNALGKFDSLPCATVVIAHVQQKEVKDPTRTYHKDTLSIGGQTGTSILYWADHTLHVRARMVGDRVERNVRTKPTDTIEAGSRGNVVPDGMRWGDDMKANYNEFRKLFE